MESCADMLRRKGHEPNEVSAGTAFDQFWAGSLVRQAFDEIDKVVIEDYRPWVFGCVQRLAAVAWMTAREKERNG